MLDQTWAAIWENNEGDFVVHILEIDNNKLVSETKVTLEPDSTPAERLQSLICILDDYNWDVEIIVKAKHLFDGEENDE